MRKITRENPEALKWYAKDKVSIVLKEGAVDSDDGDSDVRVVDVEGFDGEIVVKTMKLTKKDVHPWDLFHFQYKDENLCCLTLRWRIEACTTPKEEQEESQGQGA